MEDGQLLDSIHHNQPNHHRHHSHHSQHSQQRTQESIQAQIQDAYKLEKEAFVSHLDGGSVWKINAVSLTAVTTYALWSIIRSRNLRFGPESTRVESILSHPSISSLLIDDVQLEFLLLILPVLLANTLLAHQVLALNLFIVSLILFINWNWPSTSNRRQQQRNRDEMEPSSSSSSSKDKSKNRHQRHWSKKFISDDEEEFQGMLLNNNQQDGNGGDEFDYSEKKISFEDEKLARHSRGESYTNKSSRGHSRIPSLISSINDNIPFRVSVDSTADLARHKVNPPTTYLPPGMDENDNSFSSNHNHSMEESSFHSSNSKQTIKDHISRDSLGSNLSGYSNQQGESFSDSLRSGLPPLKTSNVGDGEVDGYGNDRRQSLKSTTSSHSSYGSPIESSNSNKPIGGRNSFATTGSSNHQSQEKIGRITSPLGRTRVSNPNLSSSFKETDGRIENLQGGDESQLDSNSISRTNPQYHPFRHQHRSQQFSSSSTVSSNFSNGISSSSPSRPPSAPPISNTSSSTTNRYSSNPNTNERYNDQVGGSFTNSVPTSPQQSFRSINQNQFSPISEPLDRNRSSFSSTPLLSEQDQSQLTQQSSSSTTQFDRSTSISQSRSTTSSSNRNPFVSPQPFLTIYRSHMMLMTVICILAVDFRIFPREFAKCETYGTSLMDLGVGSFVFSLGLISALPILKSPRNRFKPLRKQLLTSLRKSLPLLVIGGIRVLLVKGVDYHEHISEYGLHWNFFITLGLLPILTILISKVFSRFFRFNSIGLTIGIVYQLLLSLTSLESFVISNDLSDRTNLFSQNKEGIFSLFGYLSIFLIGLDLGFYVLPLDPYFAYRKLSKTRRKPKTEKLIMILFSFSIIWWFSFGGLSLLGMKVSRRLANLSYVIWVAAFNTSFITAYTCVYWFWLRDLKEEEGRVAKEIEGSQDHDHDREKDHVKSLTPAILDALNSHSFTIFLVANLLTGVINLSIKTIHTGPILSILILTLYLSLCMGLAVVMERKGWKIRF